MVEGTRLRLGAGQVVLGEVLGEGGMGVVRRGMMRYSADGSGRASTSHPVAVKLLSPALRSEQRARELFVGEAEALARLSHPNIVHFFALTEFEGQLALVMEYVHGRSLSTVIAEHVSRARVGGLPAMAMLPCWHLFSQLLGALAATHALSIVHRDVKPSNVLVRPDGVVKLTDYGIARMPSSAPQSANDMAPGTGAYMSPEQVTGNRLDARSDLYAAAIVLFEMLTGRTPFDNPSRSEIAVRAAQLQETAPPVTQLVPQAPAVLDVLLARALAKDPWHRFGSALELGEALRDALGLPDTAGWTAQRLLAENAAAISRLVPEAGPAPAPGEADRLRTAVMSAYRSST